MLDDEKRKLIEAEERFRHDLKMELELEASKLRLDANSLSTQAKQIEKKRLQKLWSF